MKQQPDREGGLQERTMQLTRIKVEGYKSFKSLDVEMRPLNVLIGANGAGKSNFLSLFQLLHEMAEERFQKTIAIGGGANSFLRFGEKETSSIRICLEFDSHLVGKYVVKWVASKKETLLFAEESISESSVIDPKNTKESFLADDWSYCRPPADVYSILELLKRTHFYHLNDTGNGAPYKKQCNINDNFYLRSDGENLAAYLYKIKHKYPKNYELIRKTIRLVAPFFDDFVLRPMSVNEHRIMLEWCERDSDHPFFAYQFPDGLIRFMCLATLLLLPKEELPSLILIDEPELSLHPSAITLLASLLRLASEKTQVIIATQSVALVNQFQPEDLLVVERRDGSSVIERQNADRLKSWLEEYSLGELWEKGVLGGEPA